jgi:hypothetical protein
MSTRPTTATHGTPSTHTDDTTDFSTGDASATPSSNDTPNSDAPTPGGDVPWTSRCKQQFATSDAQRMRNLADGENEAMHDGV